MRKSMSRATTFERVLIISCHVSLHRKIGPVPSHNKVSPHTVMNAALEPVARAVLCAIAANQEVMVIVASCS
jgi:hypothetical protein